MPWRINSSWFGIEQTTFAQFARRTAAVFRGEATYSLTPA
jgi:hypothetical protein